MLTNWFPSLEELAADPNYTEAPVVSIQTQDFGKAPDDVVEELISNGYVVRQVFSTEEFQNTINNGVFSEPALDDAHKGQLLTIATKWPTDLPIPGGGHVMIQGRTGNELQSVAEDGYIFHPSVESFLQAIRNK